MWCWAESWLNNNNSLHAREEPLPRAVRCVAIIRCPAAVPTRPDAPVLHLLAFACSPHNRWHPIRIMLNNFRWSLMDYKFKGKRALLFS